MSESHIRSAEEQAFQDLQDKLETLKSDSRMGCLACASVSMAKNQFGVFAPMFPISLNMRAEFRLNSDIKDIAATVGKALFELQSVIEADIALLEGYVGEWLGPDETPTDGSVSNG